MDANVIVTGADGQLGSAIKEYVNNSYYTTVFNFIFMNRNELDITSEKNIKNIFTKYNPVAIINCAAYTNVKKAEFEEREKAYNINVKGPELLAKNCEQYNSLLIHISTDYVFGNEYNRPITEEDECNPINYYGTTKLLGEKKIIETSCNWCILRTSWVYSYKSKNFFTTMYNKIKEKKSEPLCGTIDEISVPTNANWLAYIIIKILFKYCPERCCQIFHCVPDGIASRHGFLEKIYETTYNKVESIYRRILPSMQKDFFDGVKRPFYSVMSNEKLKKVLPNINVFNWSDEVKNEIKKIMEEHLSKNNHLQ